MSTKKKKKNIQKKRCRQVDICGTWLTTGTVLKLEKWVRQKRGWRQNKDINTVGVACAKDLLADLVQRLFSNSVHVRQFELVLLLLVTLKSDLLLLFILCQYCFWHYYKYNQGEWIPSTVLNNHHLVFFCLQHMDKTLNGVLPRKCPWFIYFFAFFKCNGNEMEIKHRWLKPSSTIVCFRGWKTSSWQQLGMLFWSLIFLQRQHNTSIHQKFKHSLFLHSSFYLLLLGSKTIETCQK